MSAGGTTANSSAASGGGGPTTHHRRRFADFLNDHEKSSDHVQIACEDSSGDAGNPESNNSNSSSRCCGGGGGGGAGYHPVLHQHPVIRQLLVRKRMPESVAVELDECLLGLRSISQTLRSRKKMGRTVSGLLLVFVVVSVFLRFSFFASDNGEEVSSRLVLQNFKNEWANAQNIVSETDSLSSSSSGDLIRNRQMKELPVSFFYFFFCFFLILNYILVKFKFLKIPLLS